MIGPAVVLVVLVLAQAADSADFAAGAAALRKGSSWAELEVLCVGRLDEDPDDLRARTYLAIALASLKKHDESVAQLRLLDAAGRSVDDDFPGVGSPAAEVLNAIWAHSWSNWTPEFNRECWGSFYDSFPDCRQAPVAASRLLMAALKLDDAAEVARLEEWFERKLAAARQIGDPRRILQLWAQARVRAGRGGERTRTLAKEAYDSAWDVAAEMHGASTAAEVERCDLDCDRAYNDLALAASICADPTLLGDREANPSVRFTDVTEAAGLAGVRKSRVAVGDFDADGDPDLCLQGMLFENEGGRFTNVSKERGLAGGGASALFADPDGDGDLDVTLISAPHPRFFRNSGKRGGFKFEDATSEVGFDAVATGSTPEGAAYWDHDGDGDLDLYLAVYEKPMAVGHPDVVLTNRGDGTFEDATTALGIGAPGDWCGRGVSPADFDDDGDQDLFVSNYRLNRNVMFENREVGPVDVAVERDVHGFDQQGAFGHTIGSCWGDVDGDGDLDLFSANLAHPRFVTQGFSNLSTLLVNPGTAGGKFEDRRQERGIRFQETHSDPAFADVDNDGDLDLSITCIYEGVPSALFANDGAGHFAPITFASGAVVFNGWGQAWFDKDGDGDLDVLYASGSGVRLFENGGAADEGRWLQVSLAGLGMNRFGVGARVVVEVGAGDGAPPRRVVREVVSARGTTSQDGHVLHFGLGPAKGRVRVGVRWPGEEKWQWKASLTNRRLTLRQR